MQAQSVVRVPKITLNVGGVAADENYTMCGPSFQPNFYFMWPKASIKKTDPTLLEAEPKPVEGKKPRKKLSMYEFDAGSAAWAAARIVCDGIVEPARSREVLGRAVQIGMFHHVKQRDTRGAYRSVIRM